VPHCGHDHSCSTLLPHLWKSTLVSGILSLIVGSVPDPGRAWSIFVGVISLLAGIVVIGVFEIIPSFGIRKASQTLDR
jgi:hypothetical protein